MQVQGKVKVLNETQIVSDKFKKREIVVTTTDQYPQDILVEFQQDKTDLLKSFKVGDEVSIDINLRGREWVNPQGEAKYFNSIVGWKISYYGTDQAPLQPQPIASSQDESSDLPY